MPLSFGVIEERSTGPSTPFRITKYNISGYGYYCSRYQALFQKGPVKANEFCAACAVVYYDFQGFHFAIAEPFVGYDLGYSVYFAVI